LKIIIVYQYFGTPNGSWSTRIYELTKRWVGSGNEVTVITSPYDKSDICAQGFISKQNIDGINLVVIDSGDSNRFSIWKRVFRSILFSVVSSYYAIFIKGDILITSSGPITVGISGLLSKLFTSKKWIFELRDLWPDGGIEMGLIKGKLLIRMSRLFEKLIYKKADFIVTSSDGQKQALIQKGVLSEDIGIIYNASDNDLFGKHINLSENEINIIQGRKYFLHMGSLGFIHNVGYIIDAAYKLESLNSDILIILIGDGNEKLLLQEKVKQLNINNVVFLGQMPKMSLTPWLSNCVGTLFTTLNNKVQNTSSPNKVFDSFAASKPVVQTTQGWLKELFIENNCGVNVDPNDPSEMADAMIKYVRVENLAIQHGLNAKELAENEFDRDRLALKYLDYMNELI
jgi:glycosyltransferase involved in cell wall biosynthesis